jgi:tetratricopeptide (TPR) repeat protein
MGMRKMIRYIKILMASYYWTKAVSLSAMEDYKNAMRCLEKSSKYRYVFDEEFYIFKGFLYGALGDRDNALMNLKRGVLYVLNGKSKLNIDERKYIVNYSSMLASFAEFYGHPFCIYDDYDLKNVSQHLIEKFPYSMGKVKKLDQFRDCRE